MKRVLLGHIAVDSGGIVLADPSALSKFDSSIQNLDELLPDGCTDLNEMRDFPSPELPWSLDAFWVARCSRDNGGILGRQHGRDGAKFGDGIAASTGHGDGVYPVYALITEPADVEDDFYVGRVMAIAVDCDPERLLGPHALEQDQRELLDAARPLLDPKAMSEPGTGITSEETTTRTIGDSCIEERIIRWNDTDRISVDYAIGDLALYADPHTQTSFDEPLDDAGLEDLLATYGVRGYKLASEDPSVLLEEMLEAAVGQLCDTDTEGIALVAGMLDAVLDEETKQARPAIEIVRALVTDGGE